jgi:hypothetical protein
VIKKQAIEKNRTVRAGENGNLQIHVDLQDFGVGCAKEFIAVLDPPEDAFPLKALVAYPLIFPSSSFPRSQSR